MIEDLLEVWNFSIPKSYVIDRNRADFNLLKVWNFFQKKVLMDRNSAGWRFAKYLEVYLQVCNRQELSWLKFWIKIFIEKNWD